MIKTKVKPNIKKTTPCFMALDANSENPTVSFGKSKELAALCWCRDQGFTSVEDMLYDLDDEVTLRIVDITDAPKFNVGTLTRKIEIEYKEVSK